MLDCKAFNHYIVDTYYGYLCTSEYPFVVGVTEFAGDNGSVYTFAWIILLDCKAFNHYIVDTYYGYLCTSEYPFVVGVTEFAGDNGSV